ncbi:hypothetical protein Shyd_65220 [Streptomyces hydrogenans]|uniref:TNFR-Cys domain-containing protein n=1 Tax=Streptomyces hydrogenans TaxID=1873719 RepID=A0ABQ3PJF2_9ACTN|nr:hypothetical protein GCM10018784_02770 [Streptomyces hydrogenans]GHI25151.1 hypothetical protein Shyd_65220 [Streptomyces hydrogenans]
MPWPAPSRTPPTTPSAPSRTPSDDPTSAPPAASPLVSGRRRRPHPRRPRHGGVDGPDRRLVIATVDCPCVCHTDFTFFAADCQQCDGTGRVTYPDTAPEGCGECTQLTPCANPRAGCYVTPPRLADHEAPPCCHTPALCGGPHKDCYDAARAEAVTDALLVTAPDGVTDIAFPEAEHECDAPHPYCSRDGHADRW